MLESDYKHFVAAKVKPGQDILDQMTPLKAHMSHMSRGVATEAGELLDAFKKHIDYGRPLDVENVIEELGDLEFYLEAVRQILGVTRDQVLAKNVEKLNKRYQASYTDKEASARADKL